MTCTQNIQHLLDKKKPSVGGPLLSPVLSLLTVSPLAIFSSLCRTTELPGDSGWETILGNEETRQQEVKDGDILGKVLMPFSYSLLPSNLFSSFLFLIGIFSLIRSPLLILPF